MGSTAYVSQMNGSMPREEVVPAGCAPDAIKLFVGNIPRSYNEAQLLPLFEAFGPVVDLGIVRDKATLVSKGSAFLWFRERAHAEQAMAQLNLQCVLPDRDPGSPRGGRPLEVRRARPRQQQQPMHQAETAAASIASLLQQSAACSLQPASPQFLGSSAGQANGRSMPQQQWQEPLKWDTLLARSPLLMQQHTDHAARQQQAAGRHSDPGSGMQVPMQVPPCGDAMSEPLATLPEHYSSSGMTSQSTAARLADAMRNISCPPTNSWAHGARLQQGASSPLPSDEGIVVESYAVDHSTPLFSVAVANLHNMQTLSGAAVVMSPGADSKSVMFNVMGTREQVQAAVWMLVVLLNVNTTPSPMNGAQVVA